MTGQRTIRQTPAPQDHFAHSKGSEPGSQAGNQSWGRVSGAAGKVLWGVGAGAPPRAPQGRRLDLPATAFQALPLTSALMT